ncbi:MAG: D-alanyl-D-alanine carboxypeptidase [Clostridiales bacterium]|nr:D-alanyl-D-alanine carboxypeptidase [Clostridiales bacterium]
MPDRNRLCGLMAGIAMGFAMWGALGGGSGQDWIKTQAEQTLAQAETSPEEQTLAQAETSSEEQALAQTETLPVGQTFAQMETLSEEDARGTLQLYAQSAVLMDGDSGRILWAKDGDVRRPMASTTKIMTCILALENGDPDLVCTVSATAASQPKVRLGAPAGSQFCLNDLLYSLMLESHNDTVVTIAEQIGGSVEEFARMMNQKARDIDCEDTWFITPNGLDAAQTVEDGSERIHSTTAADLAAILRYCVMLSPKREEFLAITRTAGYSFSDADGRQYYHCTNHNAFLNMMDGALSGKTGFTGGAGYCYAAALEDSGRTFIVALLGCGWPPHKTYKWVDARKLFQYGLDHYHYRKVWREPKLRPLDVADGLAPDWKEAVRNGEAVVYGGATTDIVMNLTDKEKSRKLLLDDDEEIVTRLYVPRSLRAPVRAGEIVGRYDYLLEGEVVRSYPLFATQNVERRGFTACVLQCAWRYFLPFFGEN